MLKELNALKADYPARFSIHHILSRDANFTGETCTSVDDTSTAEVRPVLSSDTSCSHGRIDANVLSRVFPWNERHAEVRYLSAGTKTMRRDMSKLWTRNGFAEISHALLLKQLRSRL